MAGAGLLHEGHKPGPKCDPAQAVLSPTEHNPAKAEHGRSDPGTGTGSIDSTLRGKRGTSPRVPPGSPAVSKNKQGLLRSPQSRTERLIQESGTGTEL